MRGPSQDINIRIVIESLAAIALILLCIWLIENFFGRDIQENSLLSLGLLVLSGLSAGRLCQLIGLPSWFVFRPLYPLNC